MDQAFPFHCHQAKLNGKAWEQGYEDNTHVVTSHKHAALHSGLFKAQTQVI